MTRWPRVPLGEVVRHRKEFVTIDDDRQYKRCRVQTSARGVVLRDEVLGSDIKTKTQQVCRGGDFLVAEIDAKMGGYGLVPNTLEGAVVSSHYFLFTPNEERLNGDYLAWYSRSRDFFNQVRAVGSTNYAAVRPSHVLSYTMPLPPLAEQARIVALLDATADKVEWAKRCIGLVDAEMLQAVRNIIWQAGLRPGSWMSCSSFMNLRKPEILVDPDTEYQFAGVYSFGRGVFKADRKMGSSFKYAQLSRVAAGDFVYPKLMAWEGALGVVPPECDGMVVSPEFPVFKIDKEIVHPDVVDTFFRDSRTLPALKDASTGTNMRRRRIQPSRFLELEIPIPTPDEQQVVSTLLQRRQIIVDRHRATSADLSRILPSMLDGAFAA